MRWALCLLLRCPWAPCVLVSWPGLSLPLPGMCVLLEQCLTPAEDRPDPRQQHQHRSIASCQLGHLRWLSGSQQSPEDQAHFHAGRDVFLHAVLETLGTPIPILLPWWAIHSEKTGHV